MKVAFYCRVSTNDQTTENQKKDLNRLAEARNWEVVEVYEDQGVSGAKESRPALDRLMMDARQGKFKTVVCWKFDRFARSTEHLLRALQEFESVGVDFVSFSEGIDTSTPMGKMIFTFLGAIAEFERSLIQERVKAGIARAQADGVHCGRPRVGFNISMAIELRHQGVSWSKLSKRMGVSVSTLRRAIGPLLKDE